MTDLDALSDSITRLMADYSLTRDELADLLSGPADGGPDGDGRYPVTTPAGSRMMVPSPQKLAQTNRSPSAGAIGSEQITDDAAEQAAIAAKLLVRPEVDSQASGVDVLRNITSGVRNTGFGFQALKSASSGNENTAFGYHALKSLTGGSDPIANYNTAFGSFALASLTVGYKNVAVGRASADFLTTGYQNTAIGYGSFHWALAALNCVAIGFEAVHGGDGSVPFSGQGLVGVGFQALYETTGNFNTAAGTSAGRNITTGERNTAIGTNALNQLTTGSDNTAIGYGAGINNTGSGNIFLGVNADASADLVNVTVIGTGAKATTSNTFVLGVGQTIIPGGGASDIGTQAKPWGFGIFNKSLYAHSATAPRAGGETGAGLLFSSIANFGVVFGSGPPTISAAQGSLYLRTDGSGTGNRMYVNTDNGTTWTAVTTAI